MSRGVWMKITCTCEACKKCKNRQRMRAKRNGTWTPYIPKRLAREKAIAERKEAKKAIKAKLEAAKQAEKADKARQQKWRKHRNRAFKYNMERYGLKKAKFIAVIVR